MKNNFFKKNTILTLIILLILFSGLSQNVEAAKRSIFPDSKSLQPLPKDSYANLSGNINSEVGSSTVETPKEITKVGDITSTNKAVVNKDNSNSPNYFLWSIIGLAVLVLLLILYYKNRK